jgi:hypothetical protein
VEKRKTNLQSLVRHEIPIGFGLLTSRQEGTRVEAKVLVATGSFPRGVPTRNLREVNHEIGGLAEDIWRGFMFLGVGVADELRAISGRDRIW